MVRRRHFLTLVFLVGGMLVLLIGLHTRYVLQWDAIAVDQDLNTAQTIMQLHLIEWAPSGTKVGVDPANEPQVTSRICQVFWYNDEWHEYVRTSYNDGSTKLTALWTRKHGGPASNESHRRIEIAWWRNVPIFAGLILIAFGCALECFQRWSSRRKVAGEPAAPSEHVTEATSTASIDTNRR
jgi:hypothetical protein